MKLRNKRTGEIMQLSVKCENGGELKTFDLNTDKDRLGVPVHNCYDIEVIGNVHENKELL